MNVPPTFKSTAKTLRHLDSRKVLFKENFSNLRYPHGIYVVKNSAGNRLPMPFEDDLGGLDKRREQIEGDLRYFWFLAVLPSAAGEKVSPGCDEVESFFLSVRAKLCGNGIG